MTETKYEPAHVNVRIKLSALWTSMLFVFAYVDLFSRTGVTSGPTSRRARSGSAIEVALLASIAYYAWNWPKEDKNAPAQSSGLTAWSSIR